jgi:hypothetical protein
MLEDDPIMMGLVLTSFAIYFYVMFLLVESEWPGIKRSFRVSLGKINNLQRKK